MDAQRTFARLDEVGCRLEELARVAPRLRDPIVKTIDELQQIAASWRLTRDALVAICELTSDYGYSCRVNDEGRFVLDAVTESFAKVTGYTLEEIQERGGWEALIHPDDLPGTAQHAEKLRAGQRGLYSLRIKRKDGAVRWIRYSTIAQWDPVEGRVNRIHGAVQDVTDQREAEEQRRRLAEELEREHGTLQMVLQQMPACVAIAEPPDGRLIFANALFEEIFRYPPPPTRSVSEFRNYRGFHPDGKPYEPTDWPLARALLRGETVYDEDIEIERGDGTRGTIRVSAGPVRDREGKIILAVVTFYDVTEEHEAAARLQASHQRLQALSNRLVHVQEAERRAVAQELHDEIGQTMTGLKLQLETMARQAEGPLAAGLRQACGTVNHLMDQVRNLSLNLRPAMLDDLGLYPALRWLIGRYESQTNVRVDFQHAELQRRFAPEIETAAYRIVQEALNNVARHAGVDRVTVRAWANPTVLGVQVEDCGVGFVPEKALAAANSSGLSGMQERASLLGGEFTIESRPEDGTRLTATFPLDACPLADQGVESPQ